MIYKTSQIFLSGMQEVMGEEKVNWVLRSCDLLPLKHGKQPHQLENQLSSNDYKNIQAALINQYGPLSARGLAIRIGQECLKYGMHEFGLKTGLLKMKYRLLPTSTRLKTGLFSISKVIQEMCVLTVEIGETEQHYLWQMDWCPLCWEDQDRLITCPTLSGFLQEFFYWASGGKHYRVEELPVSSNRIQKGFALALDKIAFE